MVGLRQACSDMLPGRYKYTYDHCCIILHCRAIYSYSRIYKAIQGYTQLYRDIHHSAQVYSAPTERIEGSGDENDRGSWACSETVEVWDRASFTILSCSFLHRSTCFPDVPTVTAKLLIQVFLFVCFVYVASTC